MHIDFNHWFRCLESTPWTKTPLYHGRAQKPGEQAKYDAAMATKNGISKAIYALLDCYRGLNTIYKVVGVGIAVLVIAMIGGISASHSPQYDARAVSAKRQESIDQLQINMEYAKSAATNALNNSTDTETIRKTNEAYQVAYLAYNKAVQDEQEAKHKAYKAYQASPEGIAAEAKAKAAENHASILSLESSVQKAARGYANLNQLKVGDALSIETLTKEGFWDAPPTPDDGSTFTFANVVPAPGVAYAVNSNHANNPSPAESANW